MSLVLAASGGGGDQPDIPPVSQLFAWTNDSTNVVVRFVRNADDKRTSTGNQRRPITATT
ncbi:hypothetical protein [Paraburkholderia sp. ZP32-5]|uniref:hypothetical protein n=1 Tax=Paraburkholderia sp. ZP32-5 TaxID=2883245 RepID=UPI001F418BAE|nr:hypothetical protein [Paraburkholderia sp. ZP32-5]